MLAEDLAIAEDGSFEIIFGREPRGGGNWFELPPGGADSFCAYQTYGDWDRQRKGTIRIECLGGDVPAAAPQSVSAAIDAFTTHLTDSRDLFTMWVKDIPARVFAALPKNFAIPPMQPPSAMAGAWFVPIAWELAEGQAMIIEYEIPDGSPYVGICLTDRWSAMIDIETRQTSLNLGQSDVVDGRVRILLSTEDFGVPNWLDARGYRGGVVTWRASTPNQLPPRPSPSSAPTRSTATSIRRSASPRRSEPPPWSDGTRTSQSAIRLDVAVSTDRWTPLSPLLWPGHPTDVGADSRDRWITAGKPVKDEARTLHSHDDHDEHHQLDEPLVQAHRRGRSSGHRVRDGGTRRSRCRPRRHDRT